MYVERVKTKRMKRLRQPETPANAGEQLRKDTDGLAGTVFEGYHAYIYVDMSGRESVGRDPGLWPNGGAGAFSFRHYLQKVCLPKLGRVRDLWLIRIFRPDAVPKFQAL